MNPKKRQDLPQKSDDHRTYNVNTGGGDYAPRSIIDKRQGQIFIENSRDVVLSGTDLSQTNLIAQAFKPLQEKLDSMPDGVEKNIAQSAVNGLHEEAKNGDKADESKVSKWLSFLAEAAPDAFEVAVATFTNPIQGLGTVFQKVAKRVKEARNKSSD